MAGGGVNGDRFTFSIRQIDPILILKSRWYVGELTLDQNFRRLNDLLGQTLQI